MRCLFGFAFALLLPLLIGCGSDNCGWHGAGDEAWFIGPGLWQGHYDGAYEGGGFACFYVNADCTALTASTRCDVGRPSTEAHLLEVYWTSGRNELGERCGAGVGVTPDLVSEVPIHGPSFTIELTDAEGGDWSIHGDFKLTCRGNVEARRTTESGYCETDGSVWVTRASRETVEPCFQNRPKQQSDLGAFEVQP